MTIDLYSRSIPARLNQFDFAFVLYKLFVANLTGVSRSQDFQHARPGMLNSSSVSRSHLRRKNSGSCDGWTWVSDVIAQICALFLSLSCLESAAVRSNGNFSSSVAKKERKIHYSMRRYEMSFCVPSLSSRVTKVRFSFSSRMSTFQIPRDTANCSYYYSFINISVMLSLRLLANNFALSCQ